MFHTIVHVIEHHLALQKVLASWNSIAAQLTERERRREGKMKFLLSLS